MTGKVVWRYACAASFAICAQACNSAPPASEVGPQAASPVVKSDITWPERIDEATVRGAPPAAQAAIARSRVPVLLPPDPAWIQRVSVIAKPLWTSATWRDGDRTITITMRGAAHHHPHVPRTPGNVALRDALGFVTRNERIWSATWIENGVSYDVEVECPDAADSACASAAFVTDIANRLVFVGGSREVSP